MTLNDVLLHSHRQIAQIGEQLLSAQDYPQQAVYFEQLWQHFLIHEQAEEYVAFQVMQNSGKTAHRDTERALEFAVHEHHDFESFIEDIALLPEDETLINQHQQLFKALCEKITHHMQHEETHIFPQLMAQLTNEQHEQLASAYIDKCRELNKTQTKRVI